MSTNKQPYQIPQHLERYFSVLSKLYVAQKESDTCYDAAYLDLAMNLSLPMATLDKQLRLAAKAEKVVLL